MTVLDSSASMRAQALLDAPTFLRITDPRML
jgi:hypothetical protein